jgi:hypothetical protein
MGGAGGVWPAVSPPARGSAKNSLGRPGSVGVAGVSGLPGCPVSASCDGWPEPCRSDVCWSEPCWSEPCFSEPCWSDAAGGDAGLWPGAGGGLVSAGSAFPPGSWLLGTQSYFITSWPVGRRGRISGSRSAAEGRPRLGRAAESDGPPKATPAGRQAAHRSAAWRTAVRRPGACRAAAPPGRTVRPHRRAAPPGGTAQARPVA